MARMVWPVVLTGLVVCVALSSGASSEPQVGTIILDQPNSGPTPTPRPRRTGRAAGSPGKERCYGTLLGDRMVLTALDCLYDSATKRPRVPADFSLNGKSAQILKVVPPKGLGGNDYNYAIGILDKAPGKGTSMVKWTYKSLEDDGLSLKAGTKVYNCTSGASRTNKALRRVDSQVMYLTCRGLSDSTKSGSPLYYSDPITKQVKVVGVHQGKCLSKSGRGTSVCATRIHSDVFRQICDVGQKERIIVPGCADPVNNAGTDPKSPAVVSTPEGYQAVMNLDPRMGVLLLFCQRSSCQQNRCTACRYCSTTGQKVFEDLDLLRSLNHRVLVRYIDMTKLAFHDKPIQRVPYTVYRKPGGTDFYQYDGFLKDVASVFAKRTKRGGGETGTETRASLPRSAKDKSKYGEKRAPECLVPPKAKRVKTTTGATNAWKHDCTIDKRGFLPFSYKTRFLGQDQQRQTTVLKAAVMCPDQIFRIICRNTARGNHAEGNLKNFLYKHMPDQAIGALQATAGKNCEFWMVINNQPCHDKCSGAVGDKSNMPEIKNWLMNNAPGVKHYRVAWANFHPKIKFGENCVTDEAAMENMKTTIVSTAALSAAGWNVYLCTFDDLWFANFIKDYDRENDNAVKLMISQRSHQSKCYRDQLRPKLESIKINLGLKGNCVAPSPLEKQLIMPDLIGNGW